jgi:2-polyprenyl-3-methyl-5-hydroxy-6-metoxy-1,4-benzoquinol methylase
MNDRQPLFENYLTGYLSHVGGQDESRTRRKVILSYNYKMLLPESLNATVLEIGPGYGELLELLVMDLGYKNVTAIDLSKEVVDYCNLLVSGSTIWVEDTTSFLMAHAGEFDCISLMHVLEHIPKSDILPLLRSIQAALTPGGQLIVEVPNMANPFTGLLMRYSDFTHEIGFTQLSLEYVLKKASFSRVFVFEVKLPLDRLTRLLQFAIQFPIKYLVRLINKAYRLPDDTILSSAIYAVVVK